MRLRRRRRPWAAAAFVLPFAVLLLLHARHYLPFISDDALISLRYAERLLDGHGLTWNDGERVEGYSNLLWILLVAGLGRLGMDLIVAARVLGVACMVIAMWAVASTYAREPDRGPRALAIVVALTFLSLAAPIAVWAIGGLEQPLYAALLAVAIAALFQVFESSADRPPALAVLALSLGLLCLTRPDGAIFTVAAAGALAMAAVRGMPAPASRLMILVSVPVLFYLGQLGFRVLYYGELVPNTALVKIAPSAARWRDGWLYLVDGMKALSPLSFAAIASVAALLASDRRQRGVSLAIIASIWAAYVAFIGGDIFPAFRHLVPLVVVFAFALAEGTLLAARAGDGRPRLLVVAAAAALLLFVPFAWTQFSHKQSQRAITERWEWDCRELAMALDRAFSRQRPLVAVTAAGCLPYWSRLPALDMLGLNDYYLPRHPPPDIGSGFIGHELGDGKYVLERKPDMIVFNVGSGPHYRSGEELDRAAEFHDLYVPVVLSLPGLTPDPIVYVRKTSPKSGIGVTRSESTLSVPGVLFTGAGTVAAFDSAGQLIARLPPGADARLTIAALDANQRWRAEVQSPDAEHLTVDFETTGPSTTIVVRSRATTPVDVQAVVLRIERDARGLAP